MNGKSKNAHEPLFHIVKRNSIVLWKALLIRIIAIQTAPKSIPLRLTGGGNFRALKFLVLTFRVARMQEKRARKQKERGEKKQKSLHFFTESPYNDVRRWEF